MRSRLVHEGWLKNRNSPRDPNSAPRCGAKTRQGKPCNSPAMRNGRCRMHGGASTGLVLQKAWRNRWRAHGGSTAYILRNLRRAESARMT